VHAGHGAARGAGFFGKEFAVTLLVGVLHDRNAGIAALLRAIVDQAVFADVEIARAGTAAPIVFLAARDVVLEFVDAREGLFFQRDNFLENFLLARVQRFELAVVIVQDADRRGESQSHGAVRYGQGVFRVAHATAQDGIDVHVKVGMLCQERELLVQNFQALFRHVVRHHVINADLQVFEAGAIQAFYAIRDQEVSVGNQSGHHSVLANARDDGVEIGMQQGLSAADGDDGGAHGAQAVDALKHFFGGHGIREVVEFVAVGAGKIAAASGYDVREKRMALRRESLDDHADLANLAMRGKEFSPNCFACRHCRFVGDVPPLSMPQRVGFPLARAPRFGQSRKTPVCVGVAVSF